MSVPKSAPLTFARAGAERHCGAVTEHLATLRAALEDQPEDRAGIRFAGRPSLRPLLSPTGAVGSVAAGVLGPNCKPVRAILFDKTRTTNWSLGWHQDRTICVRDRVEVPGFGPWTLKGGLHHVAPPFDLLSRMVTLRVHLDDVPAANAPLMIAPGSHLAGRVSVSLIPELVRRYGIAVCIAQAGDVWLYATPIIHASPSAADPARRRVLQIDYAAEPLPPPLEWLGVR